MGVVLLVRHGQASFGAADYDVLSETGAEQSRVLGRALAAQRVAPTTVFHGRMKRQADTGAANFKLVDANVVGAKLDRCVFTGANLRGLRWQRASLRDADLRGAVTEGLDPRLVDLTGARVEFEQAVEFARYLGLRIG